MSSDVREYKKQIATRERSSSQKKNWMSKKEIYAVLDRLRLVSEEVYAKHASGIALTYEDLEKLQYHLIVLFMSDKHMPIRRSMDWTYFKTSNIDPKEHNYMADDGSPFNFLDVLSEVPKNPRRRPLTCTERALCTLLASHEALCSLLLSRTLLLSALLFLLNYQLHHK